MGLPKILENWKVVLLSFLGAATFWFFSALGKDYNYRIEYPIEFIFDQDSLVAVQPLPDYVDIDVSGGGWDLFKDSFWFGSDPIKIELENPAAIRYLTRPTILPIVSDQLDEFRINFLFTDTLYVDIDRKVSKKVTLKVDSLAVSMDNGYRMISPINLNPDTAIIFGPTSFIDTIGSEYIVRLDADEIDKTFDRFVKLGLPDGWDIYSNPPTSNVKFEVDRFDQLELATIVEMQNFPDDSSVYIADPNVTVRFVIQQALREDYFSDDFNIVVDYNLINKQDSTSPAIIVFYPENLLEVEVEPDSLSIIYEE